MIKSFYRNYWLTPDHASVANRSNKRICPLCEAFSRVYFDKIQSKYDSIVYRALNHGATFGISFLGSLYFGVLEFRNESIVPR